METFQKYEAILHEEMLTALGCTEPIAIAFAAAKARQVLGALPEEICVECSGNLIKNARAVAVPMAEDLRGIEAAAILGAVGGDADRELEVLTAVTPQDLEITRQMLARAEADAAEETKTILAEAEQRCQALKQNARTRMDQAAKRIVEGVVKG